MTKDNDISITIKGTTHHFNSGDMTAFKAMPWNERKQLIQLLEDIKQAEFVKKPNEPDPAEALGNTPGELPISAGPQASDFKQGTLGTQQTENQAGAGFDPSVKKSEQDVDDLMQRLIIQEKQHHQPIPDKSAVMKLILGVFVVILILAVMF